MSLRRPLDCAVAAAQQRVASMIHNSVAAPRDAVPAASLSPQQQTPASLVVTLASAPSALPAPASAPASALTPVPAPAPAPSDAPLPAPPVLPAADAPTAAAQGRLGWLPATSAVAPTLGSGALFAEYQRVLASLEAAINGDLRRRRSELAEATAVVKRNIEALRAAAEGAQRELDEDAAAIAERLHATRRHKLSLLQHDLSSYLLDIEGIDGFVRQVLQQAAAPPPGVSPAQHAQALVERQQELRGRAHRLMQRPFAPPAAVGVDDLPREVAERHARLERLEGLENLVNVKDEIVSELVEALVSRERQRDEHEASTARAHAFARAVQASAHDELVQWLSIAAESAARIDALHGELHTRRHEANELRGQNEQLREQNAMLRAHVEELRLMVVRSAGAPNLTTGIVAA